MTNNDNANDRDNEYLACPSCTLHEMESMLISDYESYRLDHEYISELASELWTNKGGDSVK